MLKSIALIGAIGATMAVAGPAHAADTMIKPSQVRASEIQGSAVFSRPVSLDELGKVYTDVAWSLGTRIVILGVFGLGTGKICG